MLCSYFRKIRSVELSSLKISPPVSPLLYVYFTTTVHEAFTRPSLEVQVMTAVPLFFPVTTPPLTDATEVLLLFHVTPLKVRLAGSTEAVRVNLPPT